MCKNTKRAERRHHYSRLKKRCKTNNYWRMYDNVWSKSQLGIAANTSCNCSCTMCGNPRRHFGEKTIAEKRNDEDYYSQVEETCKKEKDTY